MSREFVHGDVNVATEIGLEQNEGANGSAFEVRAIAGALRAGRHPVAGFREAIDMQGLVGASHAEILLVSTHQAGSPDGITTTYRMELKPGVLLKPLRPKIEQEEDAETANEYQAARDEVETNVPHFQ